METRTPEVRTLRLTVTDLLSTEAGNFARVQVQSTDGPGRMRFFDIPAEDFQIGDKLEFALVRVDRKMANEHQILFDCVDPEIEESTGHDIIHSHTEGA